jgi:hypothetical protein
MMFTKRLRERVSSRRNHLQCPHLNMSALCKPNPYGDPPLSYSSSSDSKSSKRHGCGFGGT